MKKVLSIGLLTLCALAVTERQADAWLNSKFSIGLNWHIQSANNNILWGMWKNGQVPGPEAFGGGAGPYPTGGGPFPSGVGPAPYMAPAGVFPFFGNNPQAFPQEQPAAFPAQTAPPPFGAQMQTQQPYYAMPQFGYQNPYQTVSYQNSGYYPNYSYPNYYQAYGYQMQAPYYWYQGR